MAESEELDVYQSAIYSYALMLVNLLLLVLVIHGVLENIMEKGESAGKAKNTAGSFCGSKEVAPETDRDYHGAENIVEFSSSSDETSDRDGF